MTLQDKQLMFNFFKVSFDIATLFLTFHVSFCIVVWAIKGDVTYNLVVSNITSLLVPLIWKSQHEFVIF
jgi:hypothetical protein